MSIVAQVVGDAGSSGNGSEYTGGGQNEDSLDYFIMNPNPAAIVYGPVAMVHVVAGFIVWFVQWDNGKTLDKLYYWAWLTAFLAVEIAWIPPTIMYLFSFFGVKTFDWLYMATVLASADGPMLMYAISLVIMVFVYINSPDQGLTVTDNTLFWWSWAGALVYTGLSILFQIVAIPAVRIWYNNKYADAESVDGKKE